MRILHGAAALFLLVVCSGQTTAVTPLPERARLRKHIGVLASAEFAGRSGKEAELSRAYLIHAFEGLKLRPLFKDSFRQDVPGTDPDTIVGQNVGAVLVGSDPKLRDEWIIVAAHFDHLGKRGDVLYPGADDNASGVAMMLEVARCLATSKNQPRRSVAFIGFDLEEAGLWGSRYYAEHSPIPLSGVKLFVTADMIGRSLGGVFGNQVFVMGSEHIPAVRPVLARSGADLPLTVGTLGADVLLLDRSDYGPFRSRKVPFLFFSTGENPCYHRPTDVPETIDYPKAEAISRLIYGVVRDSADRDLSIAWADRPDHSIAEAETIHDVLGKMLTYQKELKINATQAFLMRNAIRRLDGVLDRKDYSATDRNPVVRVVQTVLATVF